MSLGNSPRFTTGISNSQYIFFSTTRVKKGTQIMKYKSLLVLIMKQSNDTRAFI